MNNQEFINLIDDEFKSYLITTLFHNTFRYNDSWIQSLLTLNSYWAENIAFSSRLSFERTLRRICQEKCLSWGTYNMQHAIHKACSVWQQELILKLCDLLVVWKSDRKTIYSVIWNHTTDNVEIRASFIYD